MTIPPRISILALACLVLASLAGCSGKRLGGGEPSSPGTSGSALPRGTKPYTVMGQTYYPIRDGSGYSEEGVASWYGEDFHGNSTSSGEIYDMHGMTAAHKILPFGTKLRVTNLDNNKSIVVRVNDRGPFVANRIIDLTRAGADQIGMIGPGTARVRLESMGVIAGRQGNDIVGIFYIQIGAFSIRDNAHNLAKTLQNRGMATRVVFVPEISFHRIQVGPYASFAAAEEAAVSFRREYPGNFVVAP